MTAPSDKAEYMREYRQRNPDYAERQRRDGRARQRALLNLAYKYQAEYRRLYQEERRKEWGKTS
jgi:hypothetical protein